MRLFRRNGNECPKNSVLEKKIVSLFSVIDQSINSVLRYTLALFVCLVCCSRVDEGGVVRKLRARTVTYH